MNATGLQPVCMVTDLGFTPFSSRMRVQVWRVAACQCVSGRPARIREGERATYEVGLVYGLPTLLVNARASTFTGNPSDACLSRCRSNASAANFVNPTLRRLPLVFGSSKEYSPYLA
jgi:hypothetical protein